MTTAQTPKKFGGAPFYIAFLLLIFVVGYLYLNESDREEFSVSEVLETINSTENKIESRPLVHSSNFRTRIKKEDLFKSARKCPRSP